VGHIANAKEEVYRALAERLSKNPVGVSVNDTLMNILHRLYTESEAQVAGNFPMTPVTLERIATITGIKENKLKEILDSMAGKGLVLDIPRRNTVYYMLAPMVVGFFEYTFMRTREEVNMKELAELFEAYFQDPGAMAELSGGDTKIFRTLVYENLISAAVETEVLSYERASELIRHSGGGALSMCSCRHKASHMGKACNAPLDVCTSLGKTASEWLVRRGLGRHATVDELLRVLDQTERIGLVHLCDNVFNKPAYICHCCGCCCTLLRATRESGKKMAHPSNFMPELDIKRCINCGACVDSCHVRAITMRDAGNGEERPAVDRELCLGCGVCVPACPNGSLTMTRRPVLYVPPKSGMEKIALIAREKGRFDM